MGTERGVTITDALPEDQRARAAELYWQAFGAKLGRVLGPERRGTAFVERVLDPAFGIGAVDGAGRLIGLAGFKTAKGALVGGGLRDLASVYGWLGALWRGVLLETIERPVAPDTLLMDGIAVEAAARGRGVGTALLDAVTARARAMGLGRVRLDVIDTNPRARALYERRGFVAGHRQALGLLAPVFGFRSATTMTLTLAAP